LELASKLQALHHLSLLRTPKTVNKLGCLYAEVGYLKEAVEILLACGELDNKLYVSVIVNDGRVACWFPLVAWCSLHERFSFMK
jgi:hypothetical protein